jgi:Protein of unknown function (DUF3723)
LQIALSEEYSNPINFSDGEIYLKLRYYSRQADRSAGIEFANKCMMSRLSNDKRADYEKLIKNKPLVAAFDALRVFPGLWYGFQITRKWWKCDEVTDTSIYRDDVNRQIVDSMLHRKNL